VKFDTLELYPEHRKDHIVTVNSLSQFYHMKDLKALKIWEHQYAYGPLATECLENKINPDLLMLQLTANGDFSEEEHESLVTFICAIGEKCK
jgi:hypothetical protein